MLESRIISYVYVTDNIYNTLYISWLHPFKRNHQINFFIPLMLRSILIFGSSEHLQLGATYPGQPGPHRHTHTHILTSQPRLMSHTVVFRSGFIRPLTASHITLLSRARSGHVLSIGYTPGSHIYTTHCCFRPKQTGCWPWSPLRTGVLLCVSHFCTTFKIIFRDSVSPRVSGHLCWKGFPSIQMCAVLAALNCINYITLSWGWTHFCLGVLVGL